VLTKIERHSESPDENFGSKLSKALFNFVHNCRRAVFEMTSGRLSSFSKEYFEGNPKISPLTVDVNTESTATGYAERAREIEQCFLDGEEIPSLGRDNGILMTCEAAVSQTLQRLHDLFVGMVNEIDNNQGRLGARAVQSAKGEIVKCKKHVEGVLGVLREIASRAIPINGIDLPNEIIRFYSLVQVLDILQELRTHKFWPYMEQFFGRWTNPQENAFLLRQEHVAELMSLTRDGNGTHGPTNTGLIRTENEAASSSKQQSITQQNHSSLGATQSNTAPPPVGYELIFTPNGTLVENFNPRSAGNTPRAGIEQNRAHGRKNLKNTMAASQNRTSSVHSLNLQAQGQVTQNQTNITQQQAVAVLNGGLPGGSASTSNNQEFSGGQNVVLVTQDGGFRRINTPPIQNANNAYLAQPIQQQALLNFANQYIPVAGYTTQGLNFSSPPPVSPRPPVLFQQGIRLRASPGQNDPSLWARNNTVRFTHSARGLTTTIIPPRPSYPYNPGNPNPQINTAPFFQGNNVGAQIQQGFQLHNHSNVFPRGNPTTMYGGNGGLGNASMADSNANPNSGCSGNPGLNPTGLQGQIGSIPINPGLGNSAQNLSGRLSEEQVNQIVAALASKYPQQGGSTVDSDEGKLPPDFYQNDYDESVLHKHGWVEHLKQNPIEKFSGEPGGRPWVMWWSRFHQVINRHPSTKLSNQGKFDALLKCVTGPAKEVVDGYYVSQDTDKYMQAVSVLHTRYGDPTVAKNVAMKGLRECMPEDKTLAGFQAFVTKVSNYVQQLFTYKEDRNIASAAGVLQLEQYAPSTAIKDFNDEVARRPLKIGESRELTPQSKYNRLVFFLESRMHYYKCENLSELQVAEPELITTQSKTSKEEFETNTGIWYGGYNRFPNKGNYHPRGRNFPGNWNRGYRNYQGRNQQFQDRSFNPNWGNRGTRYANDDSDNEQQERRSQSETRKNKSEKQEHRQRSRSVGDKDVYYKCVFHKNDEHGSLKCPWTRDEREAELVRSERCLNCAKPGHNHEECPSDIVCRNCALYGLIGFHHTGICKTPHHPDLFKKSRNKVPRKSELVKTGAKVTKNGQKVSGQKESNDSRKRRQAAPDNKADEPSSNKKDKSKLKGKPAMVNLETAFRVMHMQNRESFEVPEYSGSESEEEYESEEEIEHHEVTYDSEEQSD